MKPAKLDDPSISPSLRRSMRDGVAYSVMAGAGETYLSAFAVFLRATTQQVGLISSLPALIGAFAQLLSAWLGRRIGSRRRIIVGAAYAQALAWLPLLGLPLLFPDHAVPWLLVTVTLYYALGHLINPQWSSLMGDLIPERWRGRFFARRNGAMSVTHFIALVAAGAVLHLAEAGAATYLGFILIFGVAALARLASATQLAHMVDPPGRVARLEIPTGAQWWRRIRHSRFSQFAIFFGLMQFAVGIAAPYFAVYMLRDLSFSYLQYMGLTAASVLTQFLTMNAWGRISDAFGNRLVLVLTGAIIPFLPSLWLVSTDVGYLLIVQLCAGATWAGFSLSAANFLYDLVPAEKRVTYLAIHNVMAAIGVFVGALLGGVLVGFMPELTVAGGPLFAYALYGVFVSSSIARLLVALIFLPRLKEVRDTRRPTAAGFVLRATRSIALAGLVFEIIGRRARRRRDLD